MCVVGDDRTKRFGDLGVRDRDESGEPLLQRGERQVVGRARGHALGERVGDARREARARVPRIMYRAGAGRLHAVDLERRRQHARDCHRADGLRPAASGDHQSVEVGLLRENLQRHRAGAGDDAGIVGRVRDHAPLARGDALHHADGFVVVAPFLDDGRAERAHGGVLVRVVPRRHADGDAHAGQLAAEGDSLPVIARRRRDHAAAALIGVERGHE